MADESHPLAHLAETERRIDDDAVVDVEMPTHERLRAFEDKVLGEKATRINGHVEKGIGSQFSRMKPEHKAHHDALVELIEAEKTHVAAGAAETAAHNRLQAAIARAEATEPED